MRLHYYRFDPDTAEDVRLENGCPLILKSCSEKYGITRMADIPKDKMPLVDCVGDTISGLSVTHAKQLLKKYGGSAWTEHCERDGTVFEVTEINSRFKYNHHL